MSDNTLSGIVIIYILGMVCSLWFTCIEEDKGWAYATGAAFVWPILFIIIIFKYGFRSIMDTIRN